MKEAKGKGQKVYNSPQSSIRYPHLRRERLGGQAQSAIRYPQPDIRNPHLSRECLGGQAYGLILPKVG
ncbi:MAG: hypothetical protein NTX36_02865 [Proteobacteria bacterium]|nr:hypothetical protein [Pseudomonadota bacterium]